MKILLGIILICLSTNAIARELTSTEKQFCDNKAGFVKATAEERDKNTPISNLIYEIVKVVSDQRLSPMVATGMINTAIVVYSNPDQTPDELSNKFHDVCIKHYSSDDQKS